MARLGGLGAVLIVQIDLQKDQIDLQKDQIDQKGQADQKDQLDQSGEWIGLSVSTVPNVHV
jgi:hypothetical protein